VMNCAHLQQIGRFRIHNSVTFRVQGCEYEIQYVVKLGAAAEDFELYGSCRAAASLRWAEQSLKDSLGMVDSNDRAGEGRRRPHDRQSNIVCAG
jgi:hypothetical protein